MKNRIEEQVKLNSFLADFRIKKESKMKGGQLSTDALDDYNLLEDILKIRIQLHKEGKQECDQIINIIGEYANSNF